MFLGQYEHTIDEKGRLTIPARYRELLSEGAYVTRGFDKNLYVLTTASFQHVFDQVNTTSLTNPGSRSLRHLLFANAERVEVDKAGRILIPQFLRQTAGLGSSAFVVGAGSFFEIWSSETWDEQNRLLDDAEANTQLYAAFDLSAT
ncbi:MAG TPA: division/cell wall cluster transcriptional repressor MraZ [Anaerolineaceae bacterium]|jgi:MraZ protein